MIGRPRQHLGLAIERARSSLWLVPTAMVLGAIALSTALLFLDGRLAGEHPSSRWWLFGGNAEGARTLLSVIAGSLITVVSVAFSVTMIAIQQASTQYTPRVLRNYTKDRGNQLVLGTYIATFTYALLVLREVRAPGEDGAGSSRRGRSWAPCCSRSRASARSSTSSTTCPSRCRRRTCSA